MAGGGWTHREREPPGDSTPRYLCDVTIRIMAPVPRLRADGAAWVADVRRLESRGFFSVAISHHITHGWQLGLLTSMAFAVASTSQLRVLSLVAQNDLYHPALLAKDIATLDVLSGGRVELGIGAGWLADDYAVLGQTMSRPGVRIDRLAEALQVIRRYFEAERVDFVGEHYRVEGMEALPRCVQNPNPPILVGGGGPRMLELAGRAADIVGIHPAMHAGRIDTETVAQLGAGAIEEKIERARTAAAAAGRKTPLLQFTCYHVRVTDAPDGCAPQSSWSAHLESESDFLKGSPAVLVGTAAECAQQLMEWRERFGITYWNLGPDIDAVSMILDRIGN